MRRSPLLLGALVLAVGPACELGTYEHHPAHPDGAVPPDGCAPLPEICDGVDNDCDTLVDDDDPGVIVDDPGNCGACGHVCQLDHVEIHKCEERECRIAKCYEGFSDLNENPQDGCESDCVKTGDYDFCDGTDNDCNGVVDDGFDLQNDPNNCGACGLRCDAQYPPDQYHVASFSCQAGSCTIAACGDGWWNVDGVLDDGAGHLGCEYPCVKQFNVEICNGEDDDCDGQVDNDPVDEIACLDEGLCQGALALCNPDGSWTCSYESDPEYQLIEDDAQGCDGVDNDCDGRVDEAYNVGVTCYEGTGACREAGVWVCDGNQLGSHCDAVAGTPGVEVCDGIDNDCDGDVDEIQPSPTAQVDAFGAFVYISTGTFTIFAHEASRPGATAADEGFGDTSAPCSLPGVMPWSNITGLDAELPDSVTAQEACQRLGAGWDLCTDSQWYRACANGALPAGGSAFPYGSTYNGTTCNGYDYGDSVNDVGPVPTGSRASCARAFAGRSVYDLSGNLKEWVRTGTTFELRGGAYNNLSYAEYNGTGYDTVAPGLECTGVSPMPANTEIHLPAVGFRCCYGGNLFQ